jgi:ABC-type branched-subunit amino acid transport system ATPase component
MALELSKNVYVLETGTVSLEGSSEELQKSDYVKKVYLGI